MCQQSVEKEEGKCCDEVSNKVRVGETETLIDGSMKKAWCKTSSGRKLLQETAPSTITASTISANSSSCPLKWYFKGVIKGTYKGNGTKSDNEASVSVVFNTKTGEFTVAAALVWKWDFVTLRLAGEKRSADTCEEAFNNSLIPQGVSLLHLFRIGYCISFSLSTIFVWKILCLSF